MRWMILLAAISTAAGETIVAPRQVAASGSCVVSITGGAFQREKCELSTEEGDVPAGFLLVIEHVSAACSTTPARGIYTLALVTRTNSEGRTIRTTHLPVGPQAMAQDQVRLVGAQNVRIYAGASMPVEVLLSTFESAPAGRTSCDVSFSGTLRRIQQ